MRVILATGDDKLNAWLSGRPEVSVVVELQYREALMQSQQGADADVVIVSTSLPGRVPLAEAVLPLRCGGTRVVLVGPPPSPQEVEDLITMGVYDILTGEQPLVRIKEALERPATLGQALNILGRRKQELAAVQRKLSNRWRLLPARQAHLLHRDPGGATETHGDNNLAAEGETTPAAPTAPGTGVARSVVAVWSPLSTGKTFVTAELGAALGAGGVPVVLVDLDLRTQGLGGRLCLPAGERRLSAALEVGPPHEPLPDPVPVWERVWVYSDGQGPVPTRPGAVMRLLKTGAPGVDWGLVDLPNEGEVVESVLAAADLVLFVVEPDWGRTTLMRQAYGWLAERKPIQVVVNRWVEAPHTAPSDILGLEPTAVFPMTGSACRAQLTGRPAQDVDPAVCSAAQALSLSVARQLSRRAKVAAGGPPDLSAASPGGRR